MAQQQTVRSMERSVNPIDAAAAASATVNTQLFTMGASNYRGEMLRPQSNGDFRLQQYFDYDPHPVVVASRGPPAWMPAAERPPRDAADRLAEVQQAMDATAQQVADMERVEPHFDLHNLAMAKTQELLEQDRMVCLRHKV
jgi:hypothetical protein